MAEFELPEKGSDSYRAFLQALYNLMVEMDIVDNTHDNCEDEVLVPYVSDEFAAGDEQKFLTEITEVLGGTAEDKPVAKEIWDWYVVQSRASMRHLDALILDEDPPPCCRCVAYCQNMQGPAARGHGNGEGKPANDTGVSVSQQQKRKADDLMDKQATKGQQQQKAKTQKQQAKQASRKQQQASSKEEDEQPEEQQQPVKKRQAIVWQEPAGAATTSGPSPRPSSDAENEQQKRQRHAPM